MRLAVRRSAGTALTETAITLSFTLMLIFGALQLGLMGYYQLQLDGAAFFFAHGYASGSTNVANLNKALGPLFPNVPINISPLSPVFQYPPNTDVPVNFTQWGSLSNRYGGASVLRPQRLQAKASVNLNASVLGGNVSLSSGSVDGRPVIGNHDDDAQGVGFNSVAADTSVEDPLTVDDQNVPPYYITLAFQWCNDPIAQGKCKSLQLRSLGLAEFLQDSNYNEPVNGDDQNGTFQYMVCHQQIFSALSIGLAFVPTRPSKNNYNTLAGPIIGTIYGWDSMPIRGEAGADSNLGHEYPLHPDAGCNGGGGGGGGDDDRDH